MMEYSGIVKEQACAGDGVRVGGGWGEVEYLPFCWNYLMWPYAWALMVQGSGGLENFTWGGKRGCQGGMRGSMREFSYRNANVLL